MGKLIIPDDFELWEVSDDVIDKIVDTIEELYE